MAAAATPDQCFLSTEVVRIMQWDVHNHVIASWFCYTACGSAMK